jgi:hypothetical protein
VFSSQKSAAAVLAFARALARPSPIPQSGAAIAHLAGSIPVEDLEIMSKAIEDECERIDPHGW